MSKVHNLVLLSAAPAWRCGMPSTRTFSWANAGCARSALEIEFAVTGALAMETLPRSASKVSC